MDAVIAAIVGTGLMLGMGLLAHHIIRDLRNMRAAEAYWHDQRRLMRRLEGMQFESFNREHFFEQVDQYRSAFDAHR